MLDSNEPGLDTLKDVVLPEVRALQSSEVSASESAPPPAFVQRPRRKLWRRVKRVFSAGRLWYYSTKAYQAKLYPLAWLIKTFSFFLFKSLFCYECRIEGDIEIVHLGFGCVVHPNVTIGKRVRMYQCVSLAAETTPGSPSRIVIEDDVVIGAHAIVLGNDEGGIRIGKGAIIGAGAIVNRDVPPGSVVLPLPSRPVKAVKKW